MPDLIDYAASMTNNIIRMPYCVKPRAWIEKLVQIGYLHPARRHDTRAVEDALRRLRAHSERTFGDLDGEGEPPAA